MANFFADTLNGNAAPQQRQEAAAPSGNFFSGTTSGVTLNSEEQATIGEINAVNVKTPETFGLAKIPADIGKGLATEMLSLPADVGGLIAQFGETTGERIKRVEGEEGFFNKAKTAFAARLMERAGEGKSLNIFGLAADVIGTEIDLLSDAFLSSKDADAFSRAGYAMVTENRAALDSMGLIPEGKTSVAYDVGAGLSSALKSVGLVALTKNPSLAAAHMGMTINSRDYIEARKAGKEPKAAARIAAQSAAAQGAIEAIGGKVFLGAARSSSFVKKVLLRTAGQSAEEGAQSAAETAVKVKGGIKDVTLEEAVLEVGYSAMIGALAGAPVTTMFTALERTGMENGLSKEQAGEVAQRMIAGKEDLKDAAVALMDRETSGLGRDETATKEAIKAVDEVIAAKEAESEGDATAIEAELTAAQDTLAEDVAAIEQERPVVDSVSKEMIAELDSATAALKAAEDAQDEAAIMQATEQVQDIKQNMALLGIDEETARADIQASKDIDTRIKSLRAESQVATDAMRSRIAALEPVTPLKATEPDTALNAQRAADIEAITQQRSGQIGRKFSELGADVKRLTGSALSTISTRLKNINPKLRGKLRAYEFKLSRSIQEGEKAILPFLKKYSSMKKNDQIALDYAMKNGDADIIEEITERYGMQKEMQQLRDLLNDTYERAADAGMDIGYRENYFPRHVKDSSGLLAYFEKTEAWSEISQAIKDKERDLGRILNDNEKAALINTLLRGYKTAQISLSRPGALKERNIDRVTADIDKFYSTSEQALMRYIAVINEAIEAQKFFGKGQKGEIGNIEDSIGFFVLQELEKGNITASQAKELTEILRARFNKGQMSTFWRVYKNVSYIDTMGSPISAITQLGDLAFSMYKNGVYRTLSSFARAAARKSVITREDIGAEKIAQEFSDQGTSAKAVNAVFKAVGLNYFDAVGKESLINASLSRFRKLAKKGDPDFRNEIEVIFGEETDSVIDDLKNGRDSENVKLLLFNELANFQPIALSEMPEAYLKSGNGRIFYMLKTFTIKQIDVYRNEAFAEIARGNVVKGMRNLIRLVSFFILMNAGADYLKDLILGRDKEMPDYLVDNIFRAFFLTKYQVYTARREGVGTTVGKTILPPFKFIDSAYKDINKAIKENGNVNPEDFKTWQSIPIAGKLYYWWFGGGAAESNKQKPKTL